LRTAVYLAALGPPGIKETAALCTRKAHYAAQQLTHLPGVSLRFDRPFFKEFTLQLPTAVAELVSRMLEAGYHAGLHLGRWSSELANCLSVAVTEKRSRAEIDGLTSALARCLSQPTANNGSNGAHGGRKAVPESR
jgi:glycine dehydrogenase subunit 1